MGIPGSHLSRRDLLRRGSLLAGGLAAAPVLGACGSGGGGSGGGSKRVVVADWGGALVEAEKKYIFEPFSKETGIEVVVAGPPTGAKIKAMVETSNIEWDLIAGGPGTVLPIGRKYFEELPDRLLNVPGVDPKYVDKNWVTYYLFSVVLGWNTQALGQGKKLESWRDFWDVEKFPGRRTLRGADQGVPPDVEFALLADGVGKDALYPLNLDRAFGSLEKLKKSVPQWWTTGAMPGQMLVSKQVAATSIFSGRVGELKNKGAPIDFTWNGGMFQLAAWSVVKGARNKENAFKLIEYSLRPEVQALAWSKYPNGPSNSKALDIMDKNFALTLPSHPKNVEVQFLQDSQWWGQNRASVIKRFQEFAAK